MAGPGEILIGEARLRARIEELGRKVAEDYAGKDLVLVCVLKGGYVFLADLMRAINLPLEVDFMAVSSYGASTRSSGIVRIIMDLSADVRGKHVLLVEDIVDSGRTAHYLLENLAARRSASVRLCCLLRKARSQELAVELDYLGFEIPDRFVVGYGLDYGERFRNLPYIAALET